jgi:arylsulfatase A-like enzyme/Flp pilus assembly protein TadD
MKFLFPKKPSQEKSIFFSSRVLFSLIVLSTIFLQNCKKEKTYFEWNPVIIISIDTLRADHLRCYGYKNIETPNIDSLARDGTLFENVYSPAPLTLPSHTSILSGLYPFEHGVRDNIGFEVPKSLKTLQVIFKEKGFKTAGIVSAFVLRKETGISNGFDFFDDKTEGKLGKLSMGEVQRNGEKTLEIAKEWLSSLSDDRFFLFFHIYEPHTPYEPPEPYRSKYRNNLYDGEVAYSDFIIGELIKFLKKKELYKKSLIVFTSDHGEGLGEHGEREHGMFVYNSTIHVPLIIKFPENKFKGRRIRHSVSLIDIYPTILELYGIGNISSSGNSLLKIIKNKDNSEERVIYSETFYPRYHFGWSELRSLIYKNFKLIKAPKSELYDIGKDKKEEKNLIEEDDEIASFLNSKLSYILSNEIPSKIGKIDPETAEKLHSLGYVGVLNLEIKDGSELPDPKDRHYLLSYIGKATFLSRAGRNEEAVKVFREVLDKDSNMIDAWSLLARSLTKLGRLKEAYEAYKRALELSPQNPTLLFQMANIMDLSGEYEKAIENLDLAINMKPDMGRAYALKAKIYFYKNDIKNSILNIEKALSINSELPLPYYIRGLIYLKEGRDDLAEKEFKTAEKYEEEGSFHSLHFNLGLFSYRRGDIKGAIEEYEKEIKYYPDNYMARTNLALLYRKIGLFDKAFENFEALLQYWKDSPQPYIFLVETYFGLRQIERAKYWLSLGLKNFPEDKKLREIKRFLEKTKGEAWKPLP